MSIKKKPSAAALLTKQLAVTVGEKTEPVADSFAQAVGKRLEERGIASVPGLPADQPQPQWYDVAVENHRRQQGLETQRKNRKRAEEEGQNAPQTTAGILSAAITGRRDHAAPIPLNGAGVLRAALGGCNGTINGATR